MEPWIFTAVRISDHIKQTRVNGLVRVPKLTCPSLKAGLNETTCNRTQDWSWLVDIKKVKFSRYRPGVTQRVGRGIALLFNDRGTRSGWVVSSTTRPQFTPGKDPVPILQEAGWAPGPVWTGGKSCPHRYSISDRVSRHSTKWNLYATNMDQFRGSNEI